MDKSNLNMCTAHSFARREGWRDRERERDGKRGGADTAKTDKKRELAINSKSNQLLPLI